MWVCIVTLFSYLIPNKHLPWIPCSCRTVCSGGTGGGRSRQQEGSCCTFRVMPVHSSFPLPEPSTLIHQGLRHHCLRLIGYWGGFPDSQPACGHPGLPLWVMLFCCSVSGNRAVIPFPRCAVDYVKCSQPRLVNQPGAQTHSSALASSSPPGALLCRGLYWESSDARRPEP